MEAAGLKLVLMLLILTPCVILGSGEENPANVQALSEALCKEANICGNFNPNAGQNDPANIQAVTKCKNAAEYLFSSSMKRPDDCNALSGVDCAPDEQKNMTCMIKTDKEMKPLSYCAQHFKPPSAASATAPAPALAPAPAPAPAE